MKSSILILSIIFFGFSGCNNGDNSPVPVKTDREMNELKEPLVKVNRYLVEKDEIIISKYVERRNWEMTKTETGLWYMILQEGEGDSIKEGSLVTINYNIKLLDGTNCYSTDSLGSESFSVGNDRVESGLDEGIRLLQNGTKARFIMPPHLAHGLMGDDDKIPSRAILIFDLEVLKVN